jgi:hypothetical protein
MGSHLGNTLIRRIAAIRDPKTRVALLRAWLPSIPAEDLRDALRDITQRAGMRDSAAQVCLLALGEALTECRRTARTGRGRAPTEPSSRPRRDEPRPRSGSPYREPIAIHDADARADTARTNEPETPPTEADWGTGRPLTLGERKSLARRPERRLLDRALRDRHPDVITAVLQNPRLTEADVARMCAAAGTPPAALERVFLSPRWAARGRVRRALATNPATPVEIALALVPLLARAELRELAADARLANAVRARALEILGRLPPTPRAPGGVQ